jgi:hypothetical protein
MVLSLLFLFFETECFFVPQAGLKLKITLPQPPEAGITGVYHHAHLHIHTFFFFGSTRV